MRVIILGLVLLVGCGDEAAPPEADAMIRCTSDTECDDGLYCTGEETCSGGMCVGGTLPCDELCDEDSRECLMGCEVESDADGDGARAIACGGDDCDDENPDRFPGNTEICDAMNRDEDCDPNTFGFRDLDDDGVADAACCNGENCGTDCNDADAGVSPRTVEVCNEVDDDCDGDVDEELLLEFWPDADNDGFGADDVEGEPPIMSLIACSPPALYAMRRGDCDDRVPEVNPGNPEVCDDADVDENCDGEINMIGGMPCECTPGDPTIACEFTLGICAGSTRACVDGSRGPCSTEPRDEVCDEAADEDCDGEVDEGLTLLCYPDSDRDGYAELGTIGGARCPVDGRCPDQFTARSPSDRSQADCDDTEPEGRLAVQCFEDQDGDGFGAGPVQYRCACESGEVEVAPGGLLDCCDVGPRAEDVFPGQTEFFETFVCGDGYDYNCDGESTPEFSELVCGNAGSMCVRSNDGQYVGTPICGESIGVANRFTNDDCALNISAMCAGTPASVTRVRCR